MKQEGKQKKDVKMMNKGNTGQAQAHAYNIRPAHAPVLHPNISVGEEKNEKQAEGMGKKGSTHIDEKGGNRHKDGGQKPDGPVEHLLAQKEKKHPTERGEKRIHTPCEMDPRPGGQNKRPSGGHNGEKSPVVKGDKG